MKKLGLLIATIVMMMLFAVSASAATEGYYTYEVENGEATITDVDTAISGDVTIPSILGGYPVTTIGYEAFWGSNLTSVTIPECVTSINYAGFSGCSSVKSFTVDVDNKNYSNDSNGVLFNKDKTRLVTYPAGNTRTSYIIPDSVTTIGAYAFIYCHNLTSISIPNSVKYITGSAFFCCDGLTSISIPNSVTDIGQFAFTNCRSLKSVAISESVANLEDAFTHCPSIISFVVDEKNLVYSSDNMGVLFNKDKTRLVTYPAGNTRTSYIIPDSVTTIASYAFLECKNLGSITIPNGVTSIGYMAFYNCENLTNITIPDSVTFIDDVAFANCENLENITIPDGITSIGYETFYSSSLTSITIPESVTSIGYKAFYLCGRLDDVYYLGSQSQWNEISIAAYNDWLLNATIHFNCCKIYTDRKHSYISEIITAPTHLIEGVKTFTCACGDSYTEAIAKLTDHTYSSVVTAPTCAAQGYTTYTCECGDSYIGDYVGTIAHSYTSTITRPATHLSEGVRTYTCSACGDLYPEAITKTTEHTCSGVVQGNRY